MPRSLPSSHLQEPPRQLTPEEYRAIGMLVVTAVNTESLKEDRLPTAAAGGALLRGDMTQLVPATILFLGRTAEIAAGIYASGEWDENSIKNAFAGSTAVQLFLFGYLIFNRDKDLPSGDSAQAFVEKRPGSLSRVVAHWAARSGIIALGMRARGQKKELAKQALFAGAAIETAVLLWALSQKRKRNESAAASQPQQALQLFEDPLGGNLG